MKATLIVFAATGCFVVGPFETRTAAQEYGDTHLGPHINDSNDGSWAVVNYLDINSDEFASDIGDVLTSEPSGGNDNQQGAEQQQGGSSGLDAA